MVSDRALQLVRVPVHVTGRATSVPSVFPILQPVPSIVPPVLSDARQSDRFSSPDLEVSEDG